MQAVRFPLPCPHLPGSGQGEVFILDIGGKEVRGGLGPVLHIRLHVGVVVRREGGRHRQHAHKPQRQHHTGRVQKPPFSQAAHMED